MNLLILGANSDIAYAIAKKFALEEKANLYLASRNTELLEKKEQDIMSRYNVKAKALFFDASVFSSHHIFYESLNPKPDGVILAFGYLGDQKNAQADFVEARTIVETNFLGAVSILEIVAQNFQDRNHGFIIALSSVAGERGRKSNYIYGAAKSGLTVYLSGLRNRLSKYDIQVITVLLGFVRTKMTENLNLPTFLTTDPIDVADNVYNAYKKRKNIIYIKYFWKWIIMIIKAIPETLFKKMNI
jgi:short-subunit dehydrogenase